MGTTGRREAIGRLAALGAAAALLPAPILARGADEHRTIGYLSLEAPPLPRPTPEQWRQSRISLALRKLGWDEGRNLAIERLHADLDTAQLARHAQELVRARVELIIANGPEAAVAAARATRKIPVVCFNLVWPEEQGLIVSFARPGRNVTGVAFYAGLETSTKRMEFLRELAPAAKRLSWLWPPDYQETVRGGRFNMAPKLEAAAQGLGFELRLHPVRSGADVERALADITAWGAQAITASSEYVLRARKAVADFALRNRLPSAFPAPQLVEAGGLLSYGLAATELDTLFNRSLGYVDRILRGAKPAELPVERPSRYELVINVNTARALNLSIPDALRVRVDRVVG
jgi:putative ABC transport system substrate-binding protein